MNEKSKKQECENVYPLILGILVTLLVLLVIAFSCTDLIEKDSVQEQYNSLTVMLNGKEVYHHNGKCNYTLHYDGKHIEVYNNIGTLYESYSDDYFSIVTEPLETNDNP